MALNFDQFASEGNKFIKDLAKELAYPSDTDRAGRILKSVLHVLRDSIPLRESFQLMAQLPMFLKAVYVMNWKYRTEPKRIKNLAEFATAVMEEDKQLSESDFSSSEDAIYVSKVVFRSLRQYVSEGEIDDITSNLKKELRDLFEEEFFW